MLWDNHNWKRHMFTAVLFTRARTWNQPRYTSTDNGLRRYSTYIQWNITQPYKKQMWVNSNEMDKAGVCYWRRQWHQYSCLENPMMEEPGRLQSMGSWRVGHDWVTSLSLFTFMNWRRKWQPSPVLLPGESQEWRSLVGCRLWSRTESDTTEAT